MPTPKMVLITTAQKATESVNANAKITSGCRSASMTGAKPWAKVCAATSATGQITKKNRYPITISRRAQRVTRCVPASRIAGHPSGDQIECDDHDQSHHE